MKRARSWGGGVRGVIYIYINVVGLVDVEEGWDGAEIACTYVQYI